MVAPNYSKNSEPLTSLHALATATVAAAKLILNFRSRRTGHEIWREELEPRLRRTLLELLVNERIADRAMGEAGLDLHCAKEGSWRVGTCEGRRPLPAAKKRHDRAEARWLQARSALIAATYPMSRATNLLIARRLQELGRDFLALRTKYVSAFEEHEKALARLDRAPAQIGEWSGTSFCDVLAQITGDLVELLDHQEHPPADYMDSVGLADRLNTLDHDAWKNLGIAVRKEAAAVEVEAPSGSLGFARKAERTVDGMDAHENRRASAISEQQPPSGPVSSKPQSPEASTHKGMTVAQVKRHERREAIREILKLNSGTVPPHKDIVKALAERGITCKTNTVTHDLRAMMRPEQQ